MHETQATGSPASTPFSYYRRYARNALLMLLGDTLALILAVAVGGIALMRLRGVYIGFDRTLLLIPLWWAGATLMRITPGWGLGPVEHLRRIELLLLALFGVLAAAQYITRYEDQPSRIAYLAVLLVAATLLPAIRAGLRALLMRAGAWGVPVVVYGTDETAHSAVRAMRDEPSIGYIPVGIFDDERPTGSTLDGLPVLGDLHHATDAAPFALLAAPAMARERMVELLEGPLNRYRRVIILPDLLDVPSLWVLPTDFLGVLGLEIARNLLNPIPRGLKTILEWALTLVTAPLWGTLLLAICLLIRLEDGGFPFFIQERVGRGGRRFRVLKFRTMRPDAEEVLRATLEADPAKRAEWGEACKLRDDPRVTRIGRLLRVTSLDELPQLVNVLLGTMSLVGPRPLPDYHHARLPARVRDLREQVLPGVTGLWQVSGRSASGDEGLVRWDTYYVRNWSIWLDLLILARTITAVLTGRGAY